MNGNRNYLFRGTDFLVVRESVVKELEKAIDSLDEARFLGAAEEELVKYFVAKTDLNVPVLRRQEAVIDPREGDVQVYDQFESMFIKARGTIFELEVPFDGDASLFRVTPTTQTTIWPTTTVGDGVLTLVATEPNAIGRPIKQAIDDELDLVEQYLTWLRADVASLKASLPGVARTRIQRRRSQLTATKDIVATLGFKLKRRPEAPQTYVAPVVRKRLQPKPPAAAPTLPASEPFLAMEEYRNILDIMGNMALVMERSPSAFKAIDEEDLRVHFLVQLNGQYEGQATGESFNFGGKTDILIRVEGRNVFIAECKYWHGSKAYSETIDQIMGYLSWRDTKAAIVVFNRNKGFSKVLDEIQAATIAHPLYRSGPIIESETRFQYVFAQAADPSREVVVTVIAFDVPNPA